MKPLEIACRACAAQPGERCQFGPLDALEYRDELHPERIEDAAGFCVPHGAVISDAAMDAAFSVVVSDLFG